MRSAGNAAAGAAGGLLTTIGRVAGRRPGRGTGTSGRDLFRWQRPSEVRAVTDGREGQVLCKKCEIPVMPVEAPLGVWTNRDPATNLPHGLTCEGVSGG